MKIIKKITVIFITLFSSYLSAATISTESAAVNVNEIFSINVIGSDFLSNVDGGGVNIIFDQNVLNILSVTINESVWDFGGFGISTGDINNSAGTVNGIMVNTFSDVNGDFTIATIEVQAVASGNSMLTLSEYGLNPWASGGSLVNPDFVDGEVIVSVAPVPLPAAIWLFASGLLLLFGLTKQQSYV